MYFLVSLIFLFFSKYSLSGVKVVCGIWGVMFSGFNNNQYFVYETETVKVQLGTHSTNCPTKSRQTFVA